MRSLLTTVLFASSSILGACAAVEDAPSPYDEDPPLSGEDVKGDAPDNPPDDSKADEIFPAQWNELQGTQTPVKSQGSRGVCSIFATIAQVEHIYFAAGMANPDFSEQHLQWSVKNELGEYANSEGSSGAKNLEAIVDFGTVQEAAWSYEPAPWSAANDPACTGGDDLPTQCYTNGEPPETANSSPRFKLPSKRWISTSEASLKHHLMAEKTGVVVGMTFFYQSWNHRRSTTPVNAQYWADGYVTYPNALDKSESVKKRAGHAILIIGWDDTLTVPMRDDNGDVIKDANGDPKMEKGFWIFKNSWGTSGFGKNHENGAGYGYLSMKYVREFGTAVTAKLPMLP